jgi:DNA primase large subunit
LKVYVVLRDGWVKKFSGDMNTLIEELTEERMNTRLAED